MTVIEATKAIRRAKTVRVWCNVNRDEGAYFRVSKSEAIAAIQEKAGALGNCVYLETRSGDEVVIG